jgi:hypothetical protein
VLELFEQENQNSNLYMADFSNGIRMYQMKAQDGELAPKAKLYAALHETANQFSNPSFLTFIHFYFALKVTSSQQT